MWACFGVPLLGSGPAQSAVLGQPSARERRSAPIQPIKAISHPCRGAPVVQAEDGSYRTIEPPKMKGCVGIVVYTVSPAVSTTESYNSQCHQRGATGLQR